MESVPEEIMLAICDRLSLRDCCRLCATCRRLSSLLPVVVSPFRIRRIVVKEPDFVDVDFLRRSGLADAIREVVVVLDLFGKPTIEYLQSLFRVCTGVKTLSVKSTANSRNSERIWKPLTLLISGLAVEELDVEPNLRKYFLMPSSVERCAFGHDYVVNTNRLMLGQTKLHNLYRVTPTTDVAENLRRIRRVMIRIGDSCYGIEAVWDGLARFPALVDLTIRGLTKKNFFTGVGKLSAASCNLLTTLNLDVPLTPPDLKTLPDLPHLRTLSLGKLRLQDDDVEPGVRMDIRWPPSLRDLRIAGDRITDESRLYSWLASSGFDENRSVERVYVDLRDNDWPAAISWTATSEMLRLVSGFRPGILRDLLFVVETLDDWRDVITHLETAESFNCVRLLFAGGTGPVLRRIAATISRGVGVETRVETPIHRLILADKDSYRCESAFEHYEFNTYNFAILSLFDRVDSYELHACLPVISGCDDAATADARRHAARWESVRHRASTLTLHATSLNVTSLNADFLRGAFRNAVERVATSLTRLRLKGHCEVDLAALAATAVNLESLEIENCEFSGRKGVVDLSALSSFAKLKKLSVSIHEENAKAWLDGGQALAFRRLASPGFDRLQIHYVTREGSGLSGWKSHQRTITQFLTDFGVKEFRGGFACGFSPYQ